MATRVEEPTIGTRQTPVEITDSQGEASSELSSLSRSPSRGSSPENITSKSHRYPYEDKRPIPNTAVARHYPTLWVFGNKNDREPLVLKCPTCDTCIDEDPYKSDQATDHFKECRLPFENVQDLINRYATRGQCKPVPYHRSPVPPGLLRSPILVYFSTFPFLWGASLLG